MVVAFDFAEGIEEAAVAQVDGLRPVGAEIDPGAHGAVDSAVGEAFQGERPETVTDGRQGKAEGSARRQVAQIEQLRHGLGATHGISRPPARRFAARASTKRRSERRFK